MYKVKILEAGDSNKLELKINEFLDEEQSFTSFELVDIKINTYVEKGYVYSSAMVIYQK